MGEYAYTLGTLKSTNDNYKLVLSPTSDKFEITKAPSGSATVSTIYELDANGVTGGTIPLASYLPTGAQFVSSSVTGELADKITVKKLSGTSLLYDLAQCDGGKTGTITITVSSRNYESYAITINVKTKKASINNNFNKQNQSSSITGAYATNLKDYASSLGGSTVEVQLNLTPKNEGSVDGYVLSRMKSAISGAYSGIDESKIGKEYIDISLWQKINNDAGRDIPDTGRVLEIEVSMNLSGKYNPIVFRDHNGSVSRFSELSSRGGYNDGTYYVDRTGGHIYIYTRYFSTYSIAYTTVPMYRVTFDNGMGNKNEVTVEGGTVVAKPADPTRTGYTFTGWFLNGTLYNFANPVNGDMTLVAGWSIETQQTQAGFLANGDSNDPLGLPRTGDNLPAIWFWVVIFAIGFGLVIYAVFGLVSEKRRA